MNSKRSMWKVFLGVVGVGLLVTNCTIKTDDSCTPGEKKNCEACDKGVTGTQTCLDDGTYDVCYCPGSNTGGGSSVAGASSAGASSVAGGSSGGASNGGASSGSAGEAGAGEAGAMTSGDAGAGGEAPTVFASCEDCLDARCSKEYAACDANPNCISANIDGSGQYERIAACINKERVKGLVKRDVVRGCGVTIGVSPEPDFMTDWAPEGMDPTTTDLLNCMADAPGAKPASWANDNANFPVDANDNVNPTPWAAGTCAKDACTSAL
jgi:hypothetical protein